MISQNPKNKKVIVITGTSSGVGAAFAKLAKQKSNCFLIGVGRDDYDASGCVEKYIKADLLNNADIDNVIGIIKKETGRVDVLINNAGVGYKGTIEDLSIRDIKKQIQVNFIAPVTLIQGILPLMRKQKQGHIINVCSIGAYTKTPTFGYYAITKNMLLMSSEILREEIRPWNIKISILIPGAIKSNFGKNIKFNQNQNCYSKLYKEWEGRFKNYFRINDSVEKIAKQLWELIEKPQEIIICSSREKWIIIWQKLLSRKVNRYLLYKHIYYKDKEKI